MRNSTNLTGPLVANGIQFCPSVMRENFGQRNCAQVLQYKIPSYSAKLHLYSELTLTHIQKWTTDS